MAHRSRASIREEHGNRDDRILGKPRWMWVEDACRAIIATTLPDGRWQILHEGFSKFEFWAKSAFPNLSPFTFTTFELREIFAGLEKYARIHDRHLWPAFEKMYDRRHRWDAEKPVNPFEDEDDEPFDPETDIAVEKVHDGFLKRVH